MLLYYRLPGLVACITLMLQVSGQLLALSVPQFSLTLPGFAGIILSIGMAWTPTSSFRNEYGRKCGPERTLRKAIDQGFRRAFLRCVRRQYHHHHRVDRAHHIRLGDNALLRLHAALRLPMTC
jgi:hypothetical protein